MKPKKPTYVPEDDGLVFEEVGSWAKDKYRLVSLYASLFSTGMKDKWDSRVYIDLFSAAGFSKVEGTGELLAGSPILALTAEHPFDRYVFCEEDEHKLAALKQRVQHISRSANVRYIPGNCNDKVQDILDALPQPSATNRVLSLCFVDPYGVGIHFRTLEMLARRFTDFLVLLAVYMDANRNRTRYINIDSDKLDNFLGSRDWRQKWGLHQAEALRGERFQKFPQFLADEFDLRMQSIGYLPTPRMKLVRSGDKNLPLYYLALFSKHHLAYEFWEEVLKYSTEQTSFQY